MLCAPQALLLLAALLVTSPVLLKEPFVSVKISFWTNVATAAIVMVLVMLVIQAITTPIHLT